MVMMARPSNTEEVTPMKVMTAADTIDVQSELSMLKTVLDELRRKLLQVDPPEQRRTADDRRTPRRGLN
jgi:hypothetical protein